MSVIYYTCYLLCVCVCERERERESLHVCLTFWILTIFIVMHDPVATKYILIYLIVSLSSKYLSYCVTYFSVLFHFWVQWIDALGSDVLCSTCETRRLEESSGFCPRLNLLSTSYSGLFHLLTTSNISYHYNAQMWGPHFEGLKHTCVVAKQSCGIKVCLVTQTQCARAGPMIFFSLSHS